MKFDNGHGTGKQQNRTEQTDAVDQWVRQRLDQVEEQLEEFLEQNQELREELEESEVDRGELRELLEQREERIEELRGEKEELKETVDSLEDRLNSLEGDMKCPHCDGPIHAGHVEEVRQEETGGDGLLQSSSFDGPATEVRCPGCGEQVDMTDRPDRERNEFTDRLREFGIAAGEPVNEPVEEAAKPTEESEE